MLGSPYAPASASPAFVLVGKLEMRGHFLRPSRLILSNFPFLYFRIVSSMEVIATFCPQPNLAGDPQIGFWEVGAPQAPKTLSSLMGFNPRNRQQSIRADLSICALFTELGFSAT
jgi:hypothetical protein